MNEVREIVASMLADAEPPLRPAEDVLAAARRANRRRSWLSAVSGAAALVLVLAAAGLVTSAFIEPSPGPSALVPAARASAAHGEVMARKLAAALPPGLTAGAPRTFSASTDVEPSGSVVDGRPRLLAAAVVPVYGAAAEGEVFAYLVYDATSPPSDACGTPPSDVDSCEIRPVGGVAVRVVTLADHQIDATRYLNGGRLVIGSRQGPITTQEASARGDNVAWLLAPLDAPPLDAAALAALAADPAMLPA